MRLNLISKSFFRIVFLFIFSFAFLSRTNGQMRQVYVDTIHSNNEIKSISFYNGSSGFVAFTDWIGFTSDSGRTFSKKIIDYSNVDLNGYYINTIFGFSINGLKAFNKDTLIVYGDYGLVPAILYSTTGGNSFKVAFYSQFDPQSLRTGIEDVTFPANRNVGYAVDADRILLSTNYGFTWQVVKADPASYFNRVIASNANNVFAFSAGFGTSKLLKSNNGGNSWQQIALPIAVSGTLYSADFISSQKGWINIFDRGRIQNIYYTSDAGNTWKQMNNTAVTPFFCQKMEFINDSVGYAISESFNTFKTTDSGKVWELLPRDNSYSYLSYSFNDIQVLNENQLWAGGKGILEMSRNGGGNSLPKAIFDVDVSKAFENKTVTLNNFSKAGYSFKWFVNNVLISTDYNASYTYNLSHLADTIELIAFKGNVSDTNRKIQYFSSEDFPVVTSLSPPYGTHGSVVSIKGGNFSGIKSVKFGNDTAASFTIISPYQIDAVVGNGGTGNISLTDFHGTFSFPGFTYFPSNSLPPPVVTAMTPESGPVGTEVVLSGNNFNPLAENNIVYFGATKAIVTSSTSTQIVCKVPIGASFAPVAVTNIITGLSCNSLKAFNVSFPNQDKKMTPDFFQRAYQVDMAPYHAPMDVLGQDIDGDGNVDLITSLQSDSIAIFRNVSTQNKFEFEPRVNIYFTGNVGKRRMKSDDLDGDGKPDLVVVTNKNSILVFRNKSVPRQISFESGIFIGCPGASQDEAIGDVDNDGRKDIVVATYDGRGISVIKNTSVPGILLFGKVGNFAAAGLTVSVALADLDNDGKIDAVSLNNSPSSLSIFRNTSTNRIISFAEKSDLDLNPDVFQNPQVTFGDMDNDNKLDLIVSGDNFYRVYKNTSVPGKISFKLAVDYPVKSIGQGLTIANINGDNKPDVITGNWSGNFLSIYPNASENSEPKSDSVVHVITSDPYFVNTADFNGDGKPDIISSGEYSLTIFKNDISEPDSITVCEGDSVRINVAATGTTYQWQINKGTGFTNVLNDTTFSGSQSNSLKILKSTYLFNGAKFQCLVNGIASSVKDLVVNKLLPPPEVHLSASDTAICLNSPVTFTAVLSNAGANPSINWQLNDQTLVSNSNSTYTIDTLKNNDLVKVTLTTDNLCSVSRTAVSNIIKMKVSGAVPSVSISKDTKPVCEREPVIFKATAVNGGVKPTFQWKVNGVNAGYNSDTFSIRTFNNGDKVEVTMKNDPVCGTPVSLQSNTVVINFTADTIKPNVRIEIKGDGDSIMCKGTTIVFKAIATNPGLSPIFKWQVNGVTVGSASDTFSFHASGNGDKIKVKMISASEDCKTPDTSESNTITLSAKDPYPVPGATLQIPSPGDSLICENSTVTFELSTSNLVVSPIPTAKWYVNDSLVATNVGDYSTSRLKDGDQIKVTVTNITECGAVSGTSNIITIKTSSNIIPKVSISINKGTICQDSSITFIATPSNPNMGSSFQWQVNGTDVGINDSVFTTNTLHNNDKVNVILKANKSCFSSLPVKSNVITVQVNSNLNPSISISGNTSVIKDDAALIKAAIFNGGSNVLLEWQDSTSAHSWKKIDAASDSIITYLPNRTGDKIRCILKGDAACSYRGPILSNELSFILKPVGNDSAVNIRLFPNPVHTLLHIDSLSLSDRWKNLNIISLNGSQKLITANLSMLTEISIDVSSLLPGYYIAVLQNEEGRKLFIKFIKL
jgi:hypothetical protein